MRFDVRLHRKKVDRTVHVEAKIRRRGLVKPSSGDVQTRIFVATTLKIGHVEREVEVSLVDRDEWPRRGSPLFQLGSRGIPALLHFCPGLTVRRLADCQACWKDYLLRRQ